jgi:hypothetical protein
VTKEIVTVRRVDHLSRLGDLSRNPTSLLHQPNLRPKSRLLLNVLFNISILVGLPRQNAVELLA